MASGLTVSDAKSLIPEFNGNSEDLHRFLNICGMFQKEDTPEAEKTLFLQIIKTKLVGRAYEVVKYNDINTWKDLQKALQEQFMESRSRLSIQNEILSLRQSSKEDTKDYAFRARKLLALYDDATSSLTSDQTLRNLLMGENKTMVLRAFEDGLKDDYVRLLTKAKSHTDFAESTRFAIEQSERNFSFNERLSNCTKCNKRGHTADSCSSTKIKVENPRLICSYCRIPNHHVSECRKRLFQQQASRLPLSTPRVNPNPRYLPANTSQHQRYSQPNQFQPPQQFAQPSNRQFQRPQPTNPGPSRQPPHIRAATKTKPPRNKSEPTNAQRPENGLRRDECEDIQSRLNHLTITADVHPHPNANS